MALGHQLPKRRKILMATKDTLPVPKGSHTPISNLSEEAAAAETPKSTDSRPRDEGKNPKTKKARKEGAEDAPGCKGLKETAAAGTESLQAPKTSKLKAIGEASFGPPPPKAETVHGPDNRVKITNTSVYPWRAHASLLITAADNSQWIGTGWFIGPHTLMTAGHVVNIRGSGVAGRDGWVKRIQVMPGRNGASLPYGSVTSTNFRSVTGWTTSSSGDENYDYGAIIL